jgi:hypothetical protein
MPCTSLPGVEPNPLHVLVVSADIARAMAARHAACGWPVPVNIEWVCSWHEAIRRARELPAHLVIVDCSRGHEGPALARHLTRHSPALDVIALADIDSERTMADHIVWPWSALALVLDDWLGPHVEALSIDGVVR